MKIIIIILQAILNLVRKRRDLIANTDKIPPEIKNSIIAWYSPYCKQGMTNFDVIESYAEDFTRLNYYKYRGTIDRTPNKIVITESKTDILNIIENINTSTNDIVIKVTGVSEELKLFVQDINSVRQYISKDGVYKFTNNVYQFFGFGINKVISGINVVIEQLPTSILKDFSGNKHDAYLYGFQGKLNSGIGIYKVDFSKSQNANAFDNFERFNNKFVAKGHYNGNWSVFGQYTVDGIVKNKVTIKITGVSNLSYKLALQYGYITKDNKYIKKEMFISKDGIYSYDINNIEIPDENNIAQTIYNRFYFDKEVINDVNLIVEEIPDYPNSLCYAGKQYCKAYGLPIFDDYTIIARRTWFDKDGTFANKGSSNSDIKSLFIFENKANNKTITRTSSFGSWNNVDIPDEGINWQTKNKYNNADIVSGIEQDGSDTFTIGGYNSTNAGNWYGYHDDIILLNRSLTVDEINDITKAVFKEDILKPTFDLKATDVIDVVNDRGGN